MSLQQRTLDTSNRLAVPYEIFLDIIDAFINNVFATNIKPPEEGVNLAFLYEHKVTSKLAFVVATGNESSSWMSKILKDRFRSVRVALHLDRESRAKVHRKFPPAAISIHKDDCRWSVNALTIPEIDSFSMLYFPDRRDAKAQLLEHRLLQLVRLPSAETYACLQGIQCVYFPSVLCFDVDLNDTGVAVAMALPNLKSITVVVGATTDEGMKDKPFPFTGNPSTASSSPICKNGPIKPPI
ncbi:hypothetical protein CkaCkLH20_08934 [Colletotrichum karsti]|uniref:Uncharacterized protein n=1 Tax=Colletotrichum karsti TaxID=1095194 RepID=A0A9P6I7K6_9PEZI|nr:uncharacterized protein CkaCkLH20_08934 [Colletotrichum karsti]KAF9873475.1 hypothetical protein CkaCkLH20_08934 [Colletotrichum karsti]